MNDLFLVCCMYSDYWRVKRSSYTLHDAIYMLFQDINSAVVWNVGRYLAQVVGSNKDKSRVVSGLVLLDQNLSSPPWSITYLDGFFNNRTASNCGNSSADAITFDTHAATYQISSIVVLPTGYKECKAYRHKNSNNEISVHGFRPVIRVPFNHCRSIIIVDQP